MLQEPCVTVTQRTTERVKNERKKYVAVHTT